MVLEVILVFLGVFLVVLEVTGPQVALTQVDPTVPSLIVAPLAEDTPWPWPGSLLIVFL